MRPRFAAKTVENPVPQRVAGGVRMTQAACVDQALDDAVIAGMGAAALGPTVTVDQVQARVAGMRPDRLSILHLSLIHI